MSQVDRIYKLAFRKNFTNHECNFPPSKTVGLGDYGVMKNGFFSRLGNISDPKVGLTFDVDIDENPTRETFKSTNDITVSFLAKGAINAEGIVMPKAQVEVAFGSSKAVYFSAAAVLYNEIKDIATLGEQILNLYKEDKWKKEYVIVTRVFQGKNVIILISGTSNCKVNIEADASVPNIDLADANVKLNISHSSQTAYEIISNDVCQIGMGFSRVYDNFFIKPNFKTGTTNNELFAALDHTKSKNVVFGDISPESLDSELA